LDLPLKIGQAGRWEQAAWTPKRKKEEKREFARSLSTTQIAGVIQRGVGEGGNRHCAHLKRRKKGAVYGPKEKRRKSCIPSESRLSPQTAQKGGMKERHLISLHKGKNSVPGE